MTLFIVKMVTLVAEVSC